MANGKKVLIRDIEFLYEIGSLRFLERTWRQFFHARMANNAEHMFRVAWIALIIARHEKVKNEEKIVKMALLHDIAESRTPDTNYISKIYSTRDEERALRDMIDGTAVKEEFEELFREYEERSTIEAKIVKDADNLDVDFEVEEQQMKGHTMRKHWPRVNTRDTLFTETAKQMWDELQEIDPQSWHVNAYRKYKK